MVTGYLLLVWGKCWLSLCRIKINQTVFQKSFFPLGYIIFKVGKPKYNIDKLEHMSQVLKAVAHPLRIGIVDLLIQSKELTVAEIHNSLNIQQPEASRQLSVLKNAGLVKVKKSGATRIYELVDRDISNLLHCVENCTL